MIIVTKFGGDLIIDGMPQGLVDDLKSLIGQHRLVIVHGGGDIVSDISTRLGYPPRFVISPKGFKSRYTDKKTAQIYTMVMAGKINKEIVSALQKSGVNAVGLSGLDGGLIKAKRKKQLIIINERGKKMLIDGGYTGQIQEVETDFLRLLLKSNYVPVVSSVAMGEEAEPLNVDGDRVAAKISSALGADRLILLTDVKGIEIDGKVVTELHVSEAKEVINEMGTGMITKVYAAVEAVESGIEQVIIASGLGNAAITSALEHTTGTVIRK